MTITDIKKDLSRDNLKARVCIIGSGPAGGVLAAELAKNKIDVLLLEAGTELPNYSDESTAGAGMVSDLRFGWSRQFGGSSNLWAGRTYPLEEIDFQKRPWVPDSGWPFTFRSLVSYYKRASELLRIPAYHYFENNDGTLKKDSIFNSVLDKKVGLEDRCFQWAEKPFLVSDYLKDITKQHPSLRILLNAPVSRLQETADGTFIESACVTKPCGSKITIKADYFILAAGGIETPRILLNSNQIKPQGIGNQNDVVGCYFSTHPKADMAAIILNKSVSTSHALFMDSPLKSGSFRYGIGFSKEMQERLELLNHYVQLSPLLEFQANRAFEVLKKTKALDSSLIDRSKLIQGVLPGLGKIAYEVIGRISKLQPRTNKFLLRGFLDQYPDKDNRIRLSTEKKIDGTHKVDIQWQYSNKDKQSVLKFFLHLDEILQKSNIGKVEYSGLEKCEEWPLIGVHSHFMGGTRMGINKKTSVTDENALVHGTKNLFIAGPSLFPTYGFANPFLTIAALSIKLGDHVLKQLK